MNKRFCPKCGKESNQFFKNFCLNCFLEDHPNLVEIDKEIVIDHCKRCNQIRIRFNWVEQSPENLVEIVNEKLKVKDLENFVVKVKLIPFDKGKSIAKIKIEGELEGSKLFLERESILKPQSLICDACMKVSSNYHEGIIQIRGTKKTSLLELEEALLKLKEFLAFEEEKDSLAKIVGLKKVPNGFDVLIGSNKASKHVSVKLAKEYKVKYVYSNKLIGETDDGSRKYRNTYCVRIQE